MMLAEGARRFNQHNEVVMKKSIVAIIAMLISFKPFALENSSLRAEFKPLAFLNGWCWTGKFPQSNLTDTHCFKSVFGGTHLRDQNTVLGGSNPYQGETIYSWNSNSKSISFTYWNSIGGVSRGTAIPKAGSIIFPDESYDAPDGSKISVSTVWQNITENSFDSVTTERYMSKADKVRRVRYVKGQKSNVVKAEQLANTWIDYWNQGQPDAIPLANTFTHTSPLGRIEGRENYLTQVKPMAKQTVASITKLRTISNASEAVVLYEVLTPQGKVRQGCDWVLTNDDVITEIRSHYDASEIARLKY